MSFNPLAPFKMSVIRQSSLFSRFDFFIMGATSDTRGYALYRKMKAEGVHIAKTIVLDYKKQRPSIHDSVAYKNYYSLKSENVSYISCEIEGYGSLYINGLEINNACSLLLDITSIAIPDISRILFVFYSLKGISGLDVAYTEPKYYTDTKDLFFNYKHLLVKREYRPINEYYMSAVSRDLVLVCFLGFDRLVSKYIHERKEHSDVLVINGFPSYMPKLKDVSLEHNYELISTIGVDRVRYAQANNPFSAYNALVDVSKEHPNAILDICVLGSKPMALGASVFALKNPEHARISYPFTSEHGYHATIEVSDIWYYRINM
ncbi:MAG: hypothetical protein ACOYEL_06915 [Saccharofermentanales bacterium]|jgi:hypothetical protein